MAVVNAVAKVSVSASDPPVMVSTLLMVRVLAPLGLVFYEGAQFPAAFKGDAFVALYAAPPAMKKSHPSVR